jgi:hypothetical protein
LGTGYDVCVLREEVDDFSFSFIAPLGAYYDGIGHVFTFLEILGGA